MRRIRTVYYDIMCMYMLRHSHVLATKKILVAKKYAQACHAVCFLWDRSSSRFQSINSKTMAPTYFYQFYIIMLMPLRI